MNFEKYLTIQIETHPSVQPQDIVKLCFQAAFGAEHLLSDVSAAREYFDGEYASAEAADLPLYEFISDNVCRINLAAWKCKGLPKEWLFRMFAASAGAGSDSYDSSDTTAERRENRSNDLAVGHQKRNCDLFLNYLEIAEKIVKKLQPRFTVKDWQTYLAEYMEMGIRAVHHSRQYRECEKPSYRVVSSQYIRILPILEKATVFLQKDSVHGNSSEQTQADNVCGKSGEQTQTGEVCVIALDGRAASGKSTMAKQLGEILRADIIQMDDFFLPLPLRTEERFKTPGSNVHYERFMEEVLPYISKSESFSYRKFDCSIMDYNGKCEIESKGVRVVEGSYSCHPLFGKYADITVFSDVDPQEQMHRILVRNGEEMAEMFKNRWIPMEEQYFKAYTISGKADLKL